MFLLARAIPYLLAACLAGTQSAGAASMIDLPAGPHAVGFRVVFLQDRSREFARRLDPVTGEVRPGDRARPLQVLAWYPASTAGARLRHADYLATRWTELRSPLSEAETQAAQERQTARLTRRLGLEATALLASPVKATRDAPAAPGRFPVVIYAPGAGGTADENADLAEHLASHGYLVLASTSLGANGKAIEDGWEGVEPQVTDIGYLVGHAQTWAQADPDRIAVMGWSWGGMANVFAASRDERIRALISLDGTREPSLTQRIDVRRLTVPWLYASRTPDTIPQINRADIDTRFSLLNAAVHADVTQLIVYPMRHEDFASSNWHESSPQAYGDYSKSEVRQAYNWLAQYVHQFLEASLLQRDAARAFMARSPRENGVTPHSLRIDRNPPAVPPSTRAGLAAELARRGFAQAVAAYREAQARDPNFRLAPQELKLWGEQLMGRQRPGDAEGLLNLWVTLEPDSADAHAALGAALAATGQREKAQAHGQRALEIHAAHPGAKRLMDALRAR